MSVRRRALEALRDITENGAYANLRLKQAQDGLDARDAAWVSAAVYTALDHLSYIDIAIARYATGKPDKAVMAVLRLGIAQAEFMDTPKSAACDESVKLTKEIGKAALSGYVNAVMRTVCAKGMPQLPCDLRERLCVEFGYPRWLVDEFADEYGEEFTRAFMEAKPGGFTVRAQYPFTAVGLEAYLAEKGMKHSCGKFDSEAFILEKGFDVNAEVLFTQGKITVQSEGAMLVCRAVQAKSSMKLLDCCAAPGGKSAYLASQMKNEGVIVAWELHPHRAALTEKTFTRLNVPIAMIELKDACMPVDALNGMFDAVLIDAPCSGLGITGKPDVRYTKTSAIVDELAVIQHRLLDVCSSYVKPGGRLVYATCTISKRENAWQVERFLSEHPDFSPDTAWLPQELKERVLSGGIQLFPNVDGTEGFYIAAFERREN